MKRLLLAAIVIGAVSGCTHIRLQEGKYSSGEREDYIFVSNDRTLLYLRAPEDAPGNEAYWHWIGGYKINSQGQFIPEMDEELWKQWKFYYDIRYDNGTVNVINVGDNSYFPLTLEAPERR